MTTMPNPHHPTSEELFAYRDGELPADRRTLIEAHVLACAQCRERIDEMSTAEADLRMRPDGVGEEYFERMTQTVMSRVASAARTQVPADDPVPERVAGDYVEVNRIDRRRPDADTVEPKRGLRFPWIGITGTAAAAVAVVVVAVILFQRQGEWMRAPRPVLPGDAAREQAGAPATDSTATATGTLQGRSVVAPPARDGAGASRREVLAKRGSAKIKNVPETQQTVGSVGFGVTAKDEVSAQAKMRQAQPNAAPEASAMRENGERRADLAAGAPSSVGEELANVLRANRLPVLWNPGVSRDALLRAERDLRYLYQTGHAGADSARIRLYLAEAERARLTDPSNTEAVESISHHYRRALSLADGDAALAATARQRLADFEQEMIRLRGTTP